MENQSINQQSIGLLLINYFHIMNMDIIMNNLLNLVEYVILQLSLSY